MLARGRFSTGRAAGPDWTGVPCSYLTSFIDGVIADPLTLPRPPAERRRSGDRRRARLSGIRSIVMMRTRASNAVNPLVVATAARAAAADRDAARRSDGPADEPPAR